MSGVWVGVDPGHTTGIAVRHRDHLIWWDVIPPTGDPAPGEIVSDQTLTSIREALQRAIHEADLYVRELQAWPLGGVAIEGVVKPVGFAGGKKAFIRPIDLTAAALVLGAVRAWYPAQTTVVRPGGHGHQELASYPDNLITVGERRLGLHRTAGQSATIRHARSAFDIAGAADQTARTRTTGGAA